MEIITIIIIIIILIGKEKQKSIEILFNRYSFVFLLDHIEVVVKKISIVDVVEIIIIIIIIIEIQIFQKKVLILNLIIIWLVQKLKMIQLIWMLFNYFTLIKQQEQAIIVYFMYLFLCACVCQINDEHFSISSSFLSLSFSIYQHITRHLYIDFLILIITTKWWSRFVLCLVLLLLLLIKMIIVEKKYFIFWKTL